MAAHFLEHPPATVKQAADEIEKLTGIRRGETQVRQFLHALGLRPRKIGMIPAKADAEQQEKFLEIKLTPVLDQAKDSKRNEWAETVQAWRRQWIAALRRSAI